MAGNGQELRSRPIGELMSSFAHDTVTLLSQEVELARAEIGIQARRAGAGAGLFGAAAALALAALGALTACAILALAEAVDGWLAALIVGGALLVVSGALALSGRSRVNALAPPVPERAIEGVRRDVQAVQEGVQAGRSAPSDEREEGRAHGA